jgi:hypothetical protein
MATPVYSGDKLVGYFDIYGIKDDKIIVEDKKKKKDLDKLFKKLSKIK